MSELIVPRVPSHTFEEPEVFYTLDNGQTSNSRSRRVVEALASLADGCGYRAVVCANAEEALRLSGGRSVAFFDTNTGRNEFKPTMTIGSDVPQWVRGTPWCIRVGPKCGAKSRIHRCARQTKAIFGKCFRKQIEKEWFPWGQPRRGTEGPKEIIEINPETISVTVAALNSGPDLAMAIADTAFALELPVGSKISWIRVLPAPIGYPLESIQSVATALQHFEQVSQSLLDSDGEVRRIILSGVTLREERLREPYLKPGVSCFTVARPDLHWTPDGLNASENDEMPGGMPELVLLDLAYGLNQERWKAFFDELTRQGPLLFLISHRWSACYVPETAWLVGHLRKLGYNARLLMTDKLEELSITDAVYHNGERLGTIWRQFPIFETEGKLADLVFAARAGKVRMFPEWAHFGNKTWFYVFWKRQEWFRANLGEADFGLLSQVLPESHLVEGRNSFPFTAASRNISDLTQLKNLPEERRNELVMKICGANSLAARSYGVLMGRGIKDSDWSNWVDQRIVAREPFIVQRMFQTGIASLPVWNTSRQRAEMFRCRILMRPWVFNGKIIAVHGCAVPRECFKVHGMVSMAVVPVNLV